MSRWIRIPQPALALNAEDAPCFHYRMRYNKRIGKGESAQSIIQQIRDVAVKHSQLAAVVINCHAEPAILGLGQGIGRGNVGLFDRLYEEKHGPLVGRFYLVACEIAKVKGEKREGKGYATRDGNLFCAAMCKNAHAEVVAPRVMQRPGSKQAPVNSIDPFEGTTVLYSPGKKYGGHIAHRVINL